MKADDSSCVYICVVMGLCVHLHRSCLARQVVGCLRKNHPPQSSV